ncbi:hypothetical protein ABGB14_45165 [Nonomuraea sp. B10E15]|uniref:hypothetical protein n=1 Tax=Nonomuraea sp. B10E15 TaxID=3153560 RepID=UPI00325E1776
MSSLESQTGEDVGREPEPVDRSQVHTPAELGAALRKLAGDSNLSVRAIERRLNCELSNAGCPEKLSKSTLDDMFRKGRSRPETLDLFLRACGVPVDQRGEWRAARERALSQRPPGLGELVRVEAANLRELGVRAAIDVPGAFGDLPGYVKREVDGEICESLKRAVVEGGFVLLAGGSAVGKTRTAIEALREVAPQYWLLHPADAAHVRQVAQQRPARLVVWLDELHRYLAEPDGLSAATVRALRQSGAILLATLHHDHPYWKSFGTDHVAGGADLHERAHAVLALADVKYVDANFSDVEIRQARSVAETGDVRIGLALRVTEYGLVQTIAAAPQLIKYWKGAGPYAAALLKAAADAKRLGAWGPLPTKLLKEAAYDYLTPRERAEVIDDDWFKAALEYCTRVLMGAASALVPVAPPGVMGKTMGYRLDGYLQEYGAAERRKVQPPASCWQALVDHLHDPSDQTNVAWCARERLLYCYAEPLLRKAADVSSDAAGDLGSLLASQGRDSEAIEIFHGLADTGDKLSRLRLAQLEAERDARARAAKGDQEAAYALADHAIQRGREADAIMIYRALESAGDSEAASNLNCLLHQCGRADDLRERANAGDRQAARYLAGLLARKGSESEMWVRASAGDQESARGLASFLVERGRLAEATHVLRSVEDAGDVEASWSLSELLFRLNHAEELRIRAQAGDQDAALRLTCLASIAELRGRVDNGDPDAGWPLAKLLEDQGNQAEALRFYRQLTDTGHKQAPWHLARLLAERGEFEELQIRANAGDKDAERHLVPVMATLGLEEELRKRVQAGDSKALHYLIDLLARLGREEEAARLHIGQASTQDNPPGYTPPPQEANNDISWHSARFMARHDREEKLRERADAGDESAARWLARLLASRQDREGLRVRGAAGDLDASYWLIKLARRFGTDEDIRLLRYGLAVGGAWPDEPTNG